MVLRKKKRRGGRERGRGKGGWGEAWWLRGDGRRNGDGVEKERENKWERERWVGWCMVVAGG